MVRIMVRQCQLGESERESKSHQQRDNNLLWRFRNLPLHICPIHGETGNRLLSGVHVKGAVNALARVALEQCSFVLFLLFYGC